MSANDTKQRVKAFLDQMPGNAASSDVIASALDVPIVEVLIARVALAKRAARDKAQNSGAS